MAADQGTGQGTGTPPRTQMSAWYKAIKDRDAQNRVLRETNVNLWARLKEYVTALENSYEVIRGLRQELAERTEQPPTLDDDLESTEMPGSPPPVPS